MLKSFLLLIVLPPMNLVFLTGAGLLLQRLRPRAGWIMACVGIAGLLLLAMPAVADALLAPLERDLPITPPRDDPPQAIVVLGAEVTRTPSDPRGAVVGQLTLERLRTAAALQRKTGLPVMVTGGSLKTGIPPVGVLMASSLASDFGVPVRWTEAKSFNTWENAKFSTEILRREGISAVYVVTHPWHMPRALTAFAPTGLMVTTAPTPLQKLGGPILSDFVPRVSAWETSYLAFHEWVGRLWYAFR